MNNFDYNLFFLVVSNILALLMAVWNLSRWKEKLETQIHQNRKDINAGLESLRQEMRQRDYLMSIKLSTLIRFIEKTTDYESPTMTMDDFNNDNMK